MKKKFALAIVLALAFSILASAFSMVAVAAADYEAVDLDWKKGSYYDSLTANTNNRYYSVLRCAEGDNIKIHLPSDKWVIWVYPADAAGSFKDVEGHWYFKVTNAADFEYTIQEVSGRIPTELRLTVCPNPDSVITDTMWATFDGEVSIDTTAGYAPDGNFWNKRAYYGSLGGANTVNTRRHLILSVEEGDVVSLDFTSTKWKVWLYAGDSEGLLNVDGTKNYLGLTEDYDFEVKPIDGRTPTKVYLTVQMVADAAISKADWKAFDVAVSVKDSQILDKNGREWQPGAFYHTADPDLSVATTRRYTVISCKEGQTFKFSLAEGPWRVWAYYADDNGSIGGKYFEVKNGTEYKVEAIDGKMPTKIRLTACIEKTITDEDWAKFDLKIDVTDPAIKDKNGREWNPGAFYNTAEPNLSVATTRRYTVIPCKEGQTFKFSLAEGSWRVWAYYADDNGSIGGKYFEVKNGTEYKVEAIDGKMPTKIRLTACIEEVITDDNWAKFDLKITETKPEPDDKDDSDVTPGKIVDSTGREWSKGSFYDAVENVNTVNTRRHTVVSCKAGDTVKITVPDTSWRIWVYPADATGTFKGTDHYYFEAKGEWEYKVEAINGRTPTEIRITACPNPDSTISDAMWAAFNVKVDVVKGNGNPSTSDNLALCSLLGVVVALTLVSGVVVLRNRRKVSER